MLYLHVTPSGGQNPFISFFVMGRHRITALCDYMGSQADVISVRRMGGTETGHARSTHPGKGVVIFTRFLPRLTPRLTCRFKRKNDTKELMACTISSSGSFRLTYTEIHHKCRLWCISGIGLCTAQLQSGFTPRTLRVNSIYTRRQRSPNFWHIHVSTCY